MRTLFTSVVSLTILMMAGCNNAKSPDTVAKDVAAAEQKASTEVANSENTAAKDLGKAANQVDDKLIAFNNDAAKDAYNIAIAKADGDRKVAVANCLAQSGDAQKMCKDRAEADYDAAKADARAAATSEKR
jgi:hypothetical protein